jgi:hypothetical protein
MSRLPPVCSRNFVWLGRPLWISMAYGSHRRNRVSCEFERRCGHQKTKPGAWPGSVILISGRVQAARFFFTRSVRFHQSAASRTASKKVRT